MKLTPKQEAFVAEYVRTGNGRLSYKNIHPKASPRTCEVEASKLLRNPKVKAAVDAGFAARVELSKLTAEQVLDSLAKSAMYDTGEMFDERGNLKPIHSIPIELRRCISGLESETIRDKKGVPIGVLHKVKLLDRMRALELYGRHLKLFTDKLELGGGLTLEAIINRSIELEREGQ